MPENTSLTDKIWKKKGAFLETETLFQNFCRIQGKKKEDLSLNTFEDLADPFLFADAKKTQDIIFEAIEKKERIMIFGDYDLDGMSGTAQLFLTLKTLGAQVSYRLPSRQDGYGLSEKFIEEAHENKVKVFITTDCGISNFAEATLAKKLGMKFIITDHHSIPEKIPPADAIWHPLLKTETFPDKNLTGAGVAWYFCASLLRTQFGVHHSRKIEEELLELAVLGTVADCGALQGENRKITILGLQHLQKTENSGLQALMMTSGTDPQKLTAESIGFFLGPRLNASGRLAHPRTSLELLLGNASRAAELEKLNTERQELVKIFLEEAEAQLVLNKTKDCPATLVASEDWLSGVIGLISGKLTERYGKPTIAFAMMEGKITGSCRGPVGFNIVQAIRNIAQKNPEYFLGYGGHAEAAGLSVYPEYFEGFCLAYNDQVRTIRGEIPDPPHIEYLAHITRNISLEEIQDLEQGEPFGIGNPAPLFCFPQMEVIKAKAVGKDSSHLSLFLKTHFSDQPEFVSAIFFQAGDLLEKNIVLGEKLDILARPKINEWNGNKSISLQVIDLKKSDISIL